MDLQPTTVEELQKIVAGHDRLLPVGGGTKPTLSGQTNGPNRLDMSHLSGIIEYEPNEYTFTAYAGTAVREVQTALAEHGQYLPFDPLLAEQGATLGGTVAANTAGSGRYRYGGVRDFILGVQFVDGRGELVQSGGKVVKNSAGFDLPKFMVGSLGRFGALVSISFKVFPKPRAYVTLKAIYPSLGAALQTIHLLFTSRYEMDTLDLEPLENNCFALLVRLGGLPEALPRRIRRLQAFLQDETAVDNTEAIEQEAELELWRHMNGLGWVPGGHSLVKIPISPRRVPLLENVLHPASPPRRYTCGGNVAWLASPDIAPLGDQLSKLSLAGLVLFGESARPIIGLHKGIALAQRVKRALDPAGKYLEL